jgi:hypothetical protein
LQPGRLTVEKKQSMHRRKAERRGRLRNDTRRFPYEPILIGGTLVMPAELQRIHRVVLEAPSGATISDEMRAVVAKRWPELIAKLPPSVK